MIASAAVIHYEEALYQVYAPLPYLMHFSVINHVEPVACSPVCSVLQFAPEYTNDVAWSI